MKITLDTIGLDNALKAITRLAPPIKGCINMKSDGKVLTIISFGEANYCEYVVPCNTIEGEIEFGISLDMVKTAIQGRKTLSLQYQDTTLQIKSGSYSIDLATVDPMDIDMQKTIDQEDCKEWELSVEQGSWLKQAVSACALEPTSINPNPALNMCLSPKRAFVCCYGDDHLAFAATKQITGDMQVTIPLSTIASVLEVFSKQSFKMRHTYTRLEVFNDLCKVVMSLPAQEYMDASILIKKAQEVNRAKGKFVTIEKQTITDFLANAKALVTKERGGIAFVGDKDKLTMKIRTGAGQCTATVEMDATGIDFILDQMYFEEAVRRGEKDITIKWIEEGGSMVYMPVKNSYFLIATWQNT